MITVKQAAFSYDGRNELFSDLSFSLAAGEILQRNRQDDIPALPARHSAVDARGVSGGRQTPRSFRGQ